MLKTGDTCVECKQFAEAESAFKQAVQLAELHAEREDGELVTSLMHLGDFYTGRKQLDQAEPIYLRALEIYERLHGSQTVLSVICMRRLSEIYRSLGRLPEAKAMTERVEKIGFID